MLTICTIAQWKKYYQKFSDKVVEEVSEIQKQEENSNLIDLHVNMGVADLHLGDTKLGKTVITVSQFKSTIFYK